MIRGANYYYNTELDIKALYDTVVKGIDDPDIYANLGLNFVKDNEPLLKLPTKNIEVKHSTNITFDINTLTYTSNEPGYVYYQKNVIELLPLLYINVERTECHVIVPPKKSTRFPINKLFLTNQIYAREVKAPIFDENIEEAVSKFENNLGGKILITEGKKPVHGKIPVVTLEYNIENKIGEEDETGKIDYRERGFVHNVHKDDILAKFHPGIEPVQGKDIFDKPLPAKHLKPFTYKMGKNLVHNEETHDVVAGCDGVLIITEDNTIHVSKVQVIQGDIDLNIGNLEVNGDIIIEGNVLPGFKVQAEGNITIKGNIEEATVICGGELIVEGGIVGSEESKVEVNGRCVVGFVRNGNINVKGKMIIRQFVMHSNIIVNGQLRAIEGKGGIIGGSTCSAEGIEILTSGNRNGLKTELIVGINSERETRLRELLELNGENKENIKKLKNALGSEYFKEPATFLKKLPPNKLPIFRDIILNLKKCLTQQISLEKEQNEIQTLSGEQLNSTIKIYNMCNEGTVLQIGKVKREINKSTTANEYLYSTEQADIIEKHARMEVIKDDEIDPGEKMVE